MATFLNDLWASIFTPGPTPTLLIAANASFGALQVTLFALLLATYSAHFIALSVICAGVWWGINWFAVELKKAQAVEEEAARIRKARSEKGRGGGAETSGGEGGSEGEEEDDGKAGEETEGTETETEEAGAGQKLPPLQSLRIRGGPGKIQGVLNSAREARAGDVDHSATGAGTGLEPPSQQPGLLKRKSEGESSSADLSSVGTDSEWEKVSEGGSQIL